MNFQEKLVEKTEDLRARAAVLAARAVDSARSRVADIAQRAEGLKGSLTTLKGAGMELGLVARRHVSRFVKENSAIALEAGKDVGAIARGTLDQLQRKQAAAAPARKARKPAVARKRSSRKAA
jgi:hypothetical protein